ncbi:MAG: uracil-DNA glycosylase [Alcaligenaceae bacterium]|nr:uracil-DNA glycosylase [Alcaligenaceae bacterium]
MVNCTLCAHYYITFDPARPYGCRAFGFKSARRPSLDVLRASGEPCQAFTLKDRLLHGKSG